MNFGDIYALVLKEYPDILTVDEMSKALGVSTKTGYQLLRENKIEHLKVGRAYKVPKAHLLSYLRLVCEMRKIKEFAHSTSLA